MVTVAKSRDRRRRQAAEQRLEAFGLLRPRPVDRFADEESMAHRLWRCLQDAELPWRLFGRYLGCRPDLFSALDCFRLAEISEEATPMPLDTLREVVQRELGAPPEILFEDFESIPWRTRGLVQSHRAQLSDGRHVEVRVARSPQDFAHQLELLELLGPAFVGLPFEEILGDFLRRLEVDLGVQGDLLASLQSAGAQTDSFVVPSHEPSLSSPSVLTLQPMVGRPLEGIQDPALARRFLTLWLRQTLIVGQCPTDADFLWLAGGHLAITDGHWTEIPGTVQPGLWQYLRATAHQRSQEACHHLLPLVQGTTADADAEALTRRIRQIVPFRDGCWSERGDSVAEHLMLHWQAIRDHGFQPTPSLAAFYGGLFDIVRRARSAGEIHGDPMRPAVDDLHWMLSWNQWQDFADPQKLGWALEGQLTGFLSLPTKIDTLLDLLQREEAPSAKGSPAQDSGEQRHQRQERHANHTVMVTTLGVCMASVALLGQRFTTPWMQELSTLVFLLLGAWLLKAALVGGR